MHINKDLLKELVKSGQIKSVEDIDDLVKGIYKATLENMLESELDNELGYSKYDFRNKKTSNSRNGKRSKKVRSSVGDVILDVPRDRTGDFEPEVVPKNSRDISRIEDQIIGLYANGLTDRDISKQVTEFYATTISPTKVSQITDKLLPVIKEWHQRPLEQCYPLLWLDGFVMKIRTEGRVQNRCAHVIMGINVEGYKEVVGIWLGDGESSKFWLSVLTDLKNRGVEDILMCTIDGLSGFEEAIGSVFPQTQIQRCIVHQVRYSSRFTRSKDRKEMCADMKLIYTAPSEEAGQEALDAFAKKWGEQYAYAVKSWYQNWGSLSHLYQYTPEIRRLMYTTNPIESLNRQFRKATKTRSQFPHDDAAMKILYLTVIKMEEKWKARVQNWGLILSQLCIIFDERITKHL